MEEAVIDDIISLESSLNDEYLTLIDSDLQLASTVTAHLGAVQEVAGSDRMREKNYQTCTRIGTPTQWTRS